MHWPAERGGGKAGFQLAVVSQREVTPSLLYNQNSISIISSPDRKRAACLKHARACVAGS